MDKEGTVLSVGRCISIQKLTLFWLALVLVLVFLGWFVFVFC